MALSREDQHDAVLTGSRLREAVRRAQQHLLGLQQPAGEWCGELEGDSILESETILLFHSIGRGRDAITLKIAAYLLRTQTSTGGWANFPGGPDDVSATVKAYFALKLAGKSSSSPQMVRARDAALRLGGIGATNCFTRIYLAMFGQCDWDNVPAIPPEIILLPPWFYLNIYAMSSWSRTILVPLSIIWACQPRFEVPEGCGIEELYAQGRDGADLRLTTDAPLVSWKSFFLLVDRLLKWLNRQPVRPWRERALRKAEQWTIERFRKSDGLGAIFPPIVNAIWGLVCRGYLTDSPEVRSQIVELERLIIEEAEDARVQPCTSPVWDTALACIALHESGLPWEHSSYRRAADWMVNREVKEGGDWKVARPDLNIGGWYFEFANEFYPDIDDTAMVLMALDRVGLRQSPAARRGLNWVLGMQCKSGGWASFDVDNDRQLLCEFPFADHNAMIDPATSDITGRVLEMLGVFGMGLDDSQVQRGIDFLRREQEPDGSWFGRWGVNYVYGTWQVIKGLTSVGLPVGDPMIQHGVAWLTTRQNEDGGWGEGCNTYDREQRDTPWPSTPSQTAWAVMGLIAAGEAHSQAVAEGIAFLVRNQAPDGAWDEEWFTGTGFPRVFYLKYHLYRLYFPLFALGMYIRATGVGITGVISTVVGVGTRGTKLTPSNGARPDTKPQIHGDH